MTLSQSFQKQLIVVSPTRRGEKKGIISAPLMDRNEKGSMKKVKASDELRPEYKKENLGTGVRGKYFEEYSKGTNLVLLSPEVAKVFTTAEAVNDALLSLIDLAKKINRPNKSSHRIDQKTGFPMNSALIKARYPVNPFRTYTLIGN